MKALIRHGLGVAMVLLLGFVVVTGVMLQAYHVPSLSEAPRAYLMLRTRVFLGDALISVHDWSAHLLIFLAFLHLLESGWSRRFRETSVQWLVGWVLFALLLLGDLTGHLLPVSREGYWLYTRSMEVLRMIPGVRSVLGLLLGWQEGVSNLTYVRTYAFHVTVFLLLFGPLLVGHVRRWIAHHATLSRHRVALRSLELTVLFAAILATLGYLFPVVAHPLTDPLHPPTHTSAVWALRPAYGMSRWIPESFSALLLVFAVVYLMFLPFWPDRAAGRSRRLILTVILGGLIVLAWMGGQG